MIFISYVFNVIIIIVHQIAADDFIVSNSKCKIPDYKAFSPDATAIFMPQTYLACTNKQLLTYISKNGGKAILHVRTDIFPIYGQNITCCSSYVSRIDDNGIRFTTCEAFDSEVELTEDTVFVQCRNNDVTVYKNVHNPVVISRNIHQKVNKMASNKKPISVLIMVMDSISRLNFQRTMWKTRSYLLDNNFIEMKAYNKIDDNTYPNFMALLTGLEAGKFGVKCSASMGTLDNCPMLWYTYRDLGYATAYGEDFGRIATFNYYQKKGFSTPPTDYYFRPYVLASEQLDIYNLNGAPYCTGPETSGERQMNLAKDFAFTFKNLPYFGIFWMNTFSHQAINTPYRFDDKMKEFVMDLKAEGVLDDSIVIFLSDHGMRSQPDIRRTRAGWFEERLPLNLISVPKWFQRDFPTEYHHLRDSSFKLTSTHDVYMTLQHVLRLSGLNYTVRPSSACPHCQSLFENIPDRTCAEAGIPLEWCTCIGYLKPLNHTSQLVNDGVDYVLEHIKTVLYEYNVTEMCENYLLDRVMTAGISEGGADNDTYIFLNFRTKPFAEFIVTLGHEYQETNDFYFIRRIERLDPFVGKARCLTNGKAKMYCNCRRMM